MKRYIIITLALALGVISLHAQDTIRDYPTKYPDGLWRLNPPLVAGATTVRTTTTAG